MRQWKAAISSLSATGMLFAPVATQADTRAAVPQPVSAQVVQQAAARSAPEDAPKLSPGRPNEVLRHTGAKLTPAQSLANLRRSKKVEKEHSLLSGTLFLAMAAVFGAQDTYLGNDGYISRGVN